MAQTLRVCGSQPEAFLADLRRSAPACGNSGKIVANSQTVLAFRLRFTRRAALCAAGRPDSSGRYLPIARIARCVRWVTDMRNPWRRLGVYWAEAGDAKMEIIA